MKRRNKHRNRPKTLTQLIVRVPASVDMAELLATPDIDQIGEEDILDLPKDLRLAKFVYTGVLAGSNTYRSNKLIMVMAHVNPQSVKNFTDKHDLKWKILAAEGYMVDAEAILRYMDVDDLTDQLPCYAGHSWGY